MDLTELLPQFGNLAFTIAAFVVALSIIVAISEYGTKAWFFSYLRPLTPKPSFLHNHKATRGESRAAVQAQKSTCPWQGQTRQVLLSGNFESRVDTLFYAGLVNPSLPTCYCMQS